MDAPMGRRTWTANRDSLEGALSFALTVVDSEGIAAPEIHVAPVWDWVASEKDELVTYDVLVSGVPLAVS